MDGQRDTPQPPASPVTNWERQCVTLAGYCYVVRHGMKVQLVTPYRVSLLQRYGVTVRGNVTSVYPPLDRAATGTGTVSIMSTYLCMDLVQNWQLQGYSNKILLHVVKTKNLSYGCVDALKPAMCSQSLSQPAILACLYQYKPQVPPKLSNALWCQSSPRIVESSSSQLNGTDTCHRTSSFPCSALSLLPLVY